MQKKYQKLTSKMLKALLFILLVNASLLMGQTFVTTGGTVTSGYWNAGNTGGQADFIVPNDGTIRWVNLQIEVNDDDTYIQIGDAETASAQENKSISRTATQIEDAGGFGDGDSFDIVAIFLTSGLSSVDTTVLATGIVVDETAPAGFQVGTVITSGGNVSAGYWNDTNTDLAVTVPIAADGTLQNGSLQITGSVGTNAAENLGSAEIVLIAGTDQTIDLDDTDFVNKDWFLDSQTFSLTATLSDVAGNSTEATASITTLYIDQTSPSISSIESSTANGTYGVGESVNVTVNFDETVTLSGGDLLTNLNAGAQLTTNALNSASFSETYVIAEGDDAPSLNVTSFALSGGSTKLLDAAGNNADLVTISSNLADNTDLVVDGSTPSVTNIFSTSDDVSYGVDETVNVTITFSESITLSGGNLLVNIDASDTDVTITPFSNSTTASGIYTVAGGDASSDLTVTSLSLSGGSLVDAGGNSVDLTLPGADNLADNNAISIDGAAPADFTVSTVTMTGNDVVGGYWNSTNTGIDILVPIANDPSLEGGTIQIQGFFADISGAESFGNAVTILGTNLGGNVTVSLTDTQLEGLNGFADDQTLKITAVLADAGGNSTTGTQSANTFVIDETVPDISAISSTTSDGTHGIGDEVNVTITFSENVSISGGDLLTNLNSSAQLTTSSITNISSLSQIYTVLALDESTDLSVTSLTLSGGSVDLVDGAGNPIDLALPASNLATTSALVIDGIDPTIISITSSSADGSYGVDDIINVTVTFSEAVTLSGGNLEVDHDASATDVLITSILSTTIGTQDYTVASGDASNDLTVTALGLSVGGTLQDAGGNDVDLSDISGVTNIDDGSDILVDGADPADFTVGTVTVTGGDVVDTYWNDTNTGMTVAVPIAIENSLAGGSVQVQAFFNDISGAVDVGSAVAIAGGHLGGDLTVTLTEADVEGIAGYAEDLVLKITAVITDDGGNTTTGTQSANTFTIDTTAPTITAISSNTANGTYGVGDDVNVTITFDENVTLSGGNLITTLNTSAELSTETIANTNSISETYTIAEDDETSDLTVSAIALSIGTADLIDAAGNQADLTQLPLDNIAETSAIVVDGVLPTVTAISSTTANGNYGVYADINITITFSEAVTLSGGDLEVDHDASGTNVLISTISSSTTGTQTYTVAAGDVSSDLTVTELSLSAGSLQDAGGNDVDLTDIAGISNIDDTRNIVVDGDSPAAFQVSTVVTTGGTVVADYWNSSNTGVNVTVPIADDASLQGGKVLITAKVGSNAFEAVGDSSSILAVDANKIISLSYNNIINISGYEDGAVLTFSAVIRDDVFNYTTGTPSATTLTADVTDPTISSITSLPGSDNIEVGGSVDITITLSEAVTLVGGTVITTLETGDTDAQLSTSSISDAISFTETYTVSEGEVASDLNVSLVALSVGTLRDAAGNDIDLSLPGADNLADNSNLEIDGVIPTILTITSTTVDGNYILGDEINVTVTFSEALTLVGGNLIVTMETGGTDRQVTISSINNSSISAGTYTVQSGDASPDLTASNITLSAGSLQDAAGNDLDLTLPGSADNLAGSSDFVVDGVAPADFTVGAVITSGGTITASYWNDTNTDVEVTVPIASDASLQNGTLQIQARTGANAFENLGSSATISSIGVDQTESFTLGVFEAINGFSEGATVQFTAIITDSVGNSNTGTTSVTTLLVDRVNPTIIEITSSPAGGSLSIGEFADITISFSEAVTLAGDVLVTTLETGDTDAELTTAVFTGLDEITERYTVAEDEVSADLDVTGFDYGVGTLRDAAGNNIDLSLPVGENLADNSALIIDGDVPYIVSLSSTVLTDSLGLTETLEIDVEFSETVTLEGGNLILTLETGDTDREVTIPAFSTSTTASGIYTVQVGDVSPDLTISDINLSAGTLRDAAENDVLLTLPVDDNLADNNDILIDGIVPEAFTSGDILTIGDPVVTGYWNEDNTDFEVILPVTGTDVSLNGGVAYLEARVNANAFAALGNNVAVGTNPVTLSITRTQLETELAGYFAGGTIQVRGILTDIAGNSTIGATSGVELIIDQLDPTQTTTGTIVVSGGNVNQGYWNLTNEDITISTDLDAETSSIGGTLQLQAAAGVAGSFSDIGSDSILVTINTTHATILSAADLTSYGITDGDTLQFRALITDIAGNLTSGLAGINTLVVDYSDPADFTVGTVTATGGTVVPQYFNAGNDGAEVTVPIDPTDNSLIGGNVQLRVSIDGAEAESMLAPITITELVDMDIPITRAELEGLAVDIEGMIFTFDAFITDATGNVTLGSESSDQLKIDEIFPVANDFIDLVTTGDDIMTGYWNNTNTGIAVTVPIADDISLVGGTLQLSGDLIPGDAVFEVFPTSQNINALTGSVAISIPDTEIENLEGGVGFVDGLTIEFRAIVTDVAGNVTTSNTSSVTLEIDRAAPVAPDITALIVKGSNQVDGVWNSGADSLLLAVPVVTGGDPSLVTGFVQVLMSIGGTSDENPYELVVVDSFFIPGEDTIRFASSDIAALSNFDDLETLYSRILIQDRAGNETISGTSTHEILIDVGPPAPFDCGLLTATDGTVVTNAYNNTNTGISLEVPIADDASLLNGSAIIKVSLHNLDTFPPELVEPADIDTVTISAINTTLTLTLDHATLSALAGFGSNYEMAVTAGLLDYAGNQEVGSEVYQRLTIDLDGPELPVINDTTTVGGMVANGFWNASNSGIEVVVSTPAIADTSLLGGYFQVQGHVGFESYTDLGDPVAIATANFSELSITIDSTEIESLSGFGEGLQFDLRILMVDGRGNDTTGAITVNWLTIDQVIPIVGSFVTGSTTTDPYINEVDTLKARWQNFSDATTGISGYEYAIGNAVGSDDFVAWQSVDTTFLDTLMTYTHADEYVLNVRASDGAGNISDILSSSAIMADLETPNSTSAVNPYYLIEDWVDVNSFGGLYSDGLAGVDILWLDLSRESDTLYWDGADWVSDSTSLELPIIHDGIWNYSIAADTLTNHENYFIRLLAVDSAGNRQASATLDTFQFIINSAPELFTFASDTTTLEDESFTYLHYATDPDFETTRGDSLIYSLGVGAPAGMTIDSVGTMSWTPVDSAVGQHSYTTYVTDLLGLQDSVLCVLTVINVNDPPEPVTLLLPADSTQLMPADGLLLTFSWTTAFDIEENEVRYEITMQGSGYDTTIATLDTALTVDVSVMDYPVSIVEWFVKGFDPEDTSAVADTFHVTTSAAFAALNTDSIAVDMSRFTNLDTLVNLKNLGLTDLRWSLVEAPAWLTFSTESGTLGYADSVDIAFNIDLAGFTVGGYEGIFRLATNDPLQDTLSIDVTMGIYDIPTPVLAFYKNPAYPHFYEMMIVDSLGMIDTLILTHAGDTLELTEIDTFSYLATVEIAAEGLNSFELYASNWVGDTTIATNITVSLARSGVEWLARSPDDLFEVRGTARSVHYSSQLAILDSTLSSIDDARYRVLSDGVRLAEPVMVSMQVSTGDQAIYLRDEAGDYVELPSINDGERVRSWAESMGAFKLGPRTIIVPEHSQLSQNYPNPFNPATSIDYDIGFLDGLDQNVEFSIYNIRGQEIRNLVNTQLQPGQYSITWNGLDEQGRQVSSGIYFARLMTGKGYIKTVKMLVLR
ncbi:MAG: FlgD immunoglobulin-like domain containing protein [Candidatus Marinimicrobia bacterium]|nr:FlgD immunoglobulin-like domain containing protein [Candidatus Neomarinimicrobiota bacterium]